MMDIVIEKKKIKNIIIRVEDGVIKVSCPKYMTKDEIHGIINKNRENIEKLRIDSENKERYKNHLFGKKLPTDDEKEVEEIYRRELPKVLDDIFDKYFKMTGLGPCEYKIRKMKIRWGTCYPTRGLININLKVCERPIKQIEAVVLHEIIHLKYAYHDKTFISECEKYMPDYRSVERELKC
ncbi:SprT-like domain-containing protein [Peptoniphilus sp.]|jgi:predicted metal-dependent hydrolase|uniref:SprT-like domain-containing protein n=1 Tax=Peptoniphilus sp. TaxID=1971214 RepID=UPI003D8A9364